MKLTRKEFLAGVVGTAAVATFLPGCGPGPGGNDGGTDGGTGDGGNPNCAPPTIAGNHGHTLVVTRDEVQAGQERTYSIRGNSSHDHQVTISAADFATLGRGGSITVASSNVGGHQHSVTVTCA